MIKNYLFDFIDFGRFKQPAQVLRVATSPVAIASQIPGYSQVSTIATKTVSYSPSTPDTSPSPVDEDSTIVDGKVYQYADNVNININTSPQATHRIFRFPVYLLNA